MSAEATHHLAVGFLLIGPPAARRRATKQRAKERWRRSRYLTNYQTPCVGGTSANVDSTPRLTGAGSTAAITEESNQRLTKFPLCGPNTVLLAQAELCGKPCPRLRQALRMTDGDSAPR
jgi:hypothetical protein